MKLGHTEKILKSFKDDKRTSFDKSAGQGIPKSDQRNENVDNIKEDFSVDNRISERRLSKKLCIEKEDWEMITIMTWLKTKWI